MAIARDQPCVRIVDRRGDALDVRELGEGLDDTGDRGGECGLVDRGSPRLHEHALLCGNAELGLVEDLLGAPRIAVGDRPGLHLLAPDGAAYHDAADGDCEPAERGCLPVPGAPAAGAAGQVETVHGTAPFAIATCSRPKLTPPRRSGIARKYEPGLRGSTDSWAGAVHCTLRILRDAGLVEAERRGTWAFYRLAPDAVDRLQGIFTPA